MLKYCTILLGGILTIAITGNAQTIDTNALNEFSPSTIRETFEICRHTKLTSEQQISIAKSIEKENANFVKMVSNANGVLKQQDRNQLQKMHDKALRNILDEEQLIQYYKGIYNNEANAEGIRIADTLQQKYNLTDQNWKFIRIACYKIALESRVIKQLMSDTPKKANAAIAKLTKEQLATIEEKGGIRINPETMTVEFVREFRPNDLHKQL